MTLQIGLLLVPLTVILVTVMAAHIQDANTHSRHTRSYMPLNCVSLPHLEGLQARFRQLLDENQDGKADGEEVRRYLQTIKPNVSEKRMEEFIERRDYNKNNAIDFVPEYVHEMTEMDNTEEGAKEWFDLMNTNDNQFVEMSEIINIIIKMDMANGQDPATVAAAYVRADQDGDNKLTYKEFSTLYGQ